MNGPTRFAVLALLLVRPAPVRADVYSYFVYSLEWLADAGECVVKATVDNRYDPAIRAWTTRIVRIHETLKSEDGKPVAAIAADLKAIRTRGTHEHLLFFRRDAKKEWTLLYSQGLGKHSVPEKETARAGYLQPYFPSFSSSWSPMTFGHAHCVAIRKSGDVVTDPDDVIRTIKDRIKLRAGKKSSDDGYYAKMGAELEDNESDVNVLVPYDPEYRIGFQFQLFSKDGWTRYRAAGHLGYYNHPEVIANLKTCLDDPFVMDLRSPDAPGPGVVTPRYAVRKAAYESLRRLGVTVPQPVLVPEPKK